jgi:hypothetical protein
MLIYQRVSLFRLYLLSPIINEKIYLHQTGV